MPRLLLTFSFLIWSSFLFCQKTYFQQKVNYKIDVSLDDHHHILRGFEKMVYHNHSKDTLRFIFIHLWPNAYKNDRTAYCKQTVENGNTAFYFSEQDERGFIDSLQFKVNNELVEIRNYDNQDDIISLDLTEPLLPDRSIEITTPFRVVIPFTFSRLGHIDQSYQISQWYPKPAVYDRSGWHPMPYLDQGEFYSEFGNYEVSITLPSNYIVASTGNLQEDNEKKWIEEKIMKPDTTFSNRKSVIESSETYKTITFKESNIHDFAWFADKEFMIEKTEVALPSGKNVNCYTFFKTLKNNLYKKSSKIIAQTINYLSQHVGEYPYNQAIIVEAPLIAGEGMEYPEIAVIGKVITRSMLEKVIIHEVGHNWFYGLLASNEREFPWMDESINTFYENEINNQIAGDSNQANAEKRVSNFMDKINDGFSYQLVAKNNTDQAASLPSILYTGENYGAIIYQKTPMLFAYLKNYLGDAVFEKAMKRYFNEWHFKHPYPEDLFHIMTEESGKDLSWFFQEALGTTKKIDYNIESVKKNEKEILVQVNSKTDFKGPIPVMACNGDSILATEWIEYPYSEKAKFIESKINIDHVKIDASQKIPEINFTNNQYKVTGLFHRFQTAIRLGTGIGISSKNKFYLLPSVGYNYYDKFMIGVAIHNLEFPNNRFQFALVPMYSTGTKTLTGSGLIGYSIFPKNTIQQLTIALQGRTYHEDESHLNITHSIYLRYIKLRPSVSIDFKNTVARSPISNQIYFSYTLLSKQAFSYKFNSTDSLYRPQIEKEDYSHFGTISFTHRNKRTFNPYHYTVMAVGNSFMLKATLEANLRIDYYNKGKAFYIRFFAGKFFDFKTSDQFFALRNQNLNATFSAKNDFTYDQVFLDRSSQKGWLTHQVSMRDGGFKIQSLFLARPIGQNDNWLSSLNLRTDLPVKLPFKLQLFLDLGTYANARELNGSGNKAIFDGGAELHLLGDMIIVYAPLLMSKDFKDYTKSTYPKNRMLNSMSFSLNIDKINWLKTQSMLHQLF